MPSDDLERLFRQTFLILLPDPMRVQCGDLPRRGGSDMGEHGQRDIEMIVGVRAPGQPPFMAHLCDANRALHGPEVRIGQRDIHGMQPDRMPHLAPIRGDHVGGRREPGRPSEFGHYFPTGITVFRTARIFHVCQHVLLAAAQSNGLFQRPGAVRIDGDAGVREAFRQCRHGFDLLVPAKNAAFQLEVVEAVAGMGRLGEPYDRLGRKRFFMTQAHPVVFRIGSLQIGQVGLVAVADVEQIPEHLHRGPLLAFAQQRGNRHFQEFPQEIEQCRLQCRHGMDRDTQIKGLQAPPSGIPVRKTPAHRVEDIVVAADGLADDKGFRILQCFPDTLAPGNFTYSRIAGVVFEDDDVAREKRAVRTAQIEQHAVPPGNRNDLHPGNDRRPGGALPDPLAVQGSLLMFRRNVQSNRVRSNKW